MAGAAGGQKDKKSESKWIRSMQGYKGESEAGHIICNLSSFRRNNNLVMARSTG